MLTVATCLNLLAAFAMGLAGLRFLTASVPLDYHARIFKAEGLVLTPATTLVLRTFYRGLGAMFLSIGAAVAWLAYTAWSSDLAGVQILLCAIGAGPAIVLALLPRAVENVTGVRTPWGLSAGIAALLLVACVIGLIA